MKDWKNKDQKRENRAHRSGLRKGLSWCLVIAMILGLCPVQGASAARKARLKDTRLTLRVGQKKSLRVLHTRKKISWSVVSGKKYVKLASVKKTSVSVVGKAKGSAKVCAKLGKKRMICKVVVKKALQPKATLQPTVTAAPTAVPARTPAAASATPSPDIAKAYAKDENGRIVEDVEHLKQLITQQKAKGASVNEDLSSGQYEWAADGSLAKIDWQSLDLKGELTLPAFVALKEFSCNANQLTALDISSCKSMEILNCGYQYCLKTLKLQGCSAMKILNCYGTALQSLDLTDFQALETLYCYNTSISNLCLKGCSALKECTASYTNISSLDVSDCTNLQSLSVYQTGITALDVSCCAALDTLNCNDSVALTGWVQEEKDAAQVEALQTLIEEQKAQGVTVNEDPDSQCYTWNRRGQLTKIYWNGVCPAGAVTLSGEVFPELVSVTIGGYRYADSADWQLEVHDCGKLKELDCSSSMLTSLNISGCSSLEELYCSNTKLTSLDVGGCAALETLSCGETEISSLDVSACAKLQSLFCEGADVASLDLSGNPALQSLYCGQCTQLTRLEISACKKLKTFVCNNTAISDLNLQTNRVLEYLNCTDSSVASLDLSKNENLVSLYCKGTALTSLDISACQKLQYYPEVDDTVTVIGWTLDPAEVDALRQLILQQRESGADLAEPGQNLGCYAGCRWTRNGHLKVISWSGKGLQGTLSLSAFSELKRVSIHEYRDGSCSENLTGLDVSGCVNLKNLALDGLSHLTALDLSQCSNLKWLSTYDCSLESLDLSQCNNLKSLHIYQCPMESLNVSGCSRLKWVYCNNLYQLQSLDVSGCSNLKWLDVRFCDVLTTLDVSTCAALRDISTYQSPIASLDLSNCPKLQQNRSIQVADDTTVVGVTVDAAEEAALKTLISAQNAQGASLPTSIFACTYRWNKEGHLSKLLCSDRGLTGNIALSGFSDLQKISVSHNSELTGLDVSQVPTLEILACGYTGVKALNLTSNPALRWLRCGHTNITALDVSSNPEMEGLFCSHTGLTSLNLQANQKLYDLQCGHTSITALDISSNLKLRYLYCGYTEITSLDLSGLKLSQLKCGHTGLTSLDLSGQTSLWLLYCQGTKITTLDIRDCVNLSTLKCEDTVTVVTGAQ